MDEATIISILSIALTLILGWVGGTWTMNWKKAKELFGLAAQASEEMSEFFKVVNEALVDDTVTEEEYREMMKEFNDLVVASKALWDAMHLVFGTQKFKRI